MIKGQLQQYRDRLRALAARLGVTVAGLEDQARSMTGGEAGGGLSNAPLHLGDVGSEAYSQELGATLLENEAYIRNETLAALGRVEGGTYGLCENCGHDIVPERLDALPYARHCTACAAALQTGHHANLNNGRPEAWLGAPGHEGQTQSGSLDRAVGSDLGSARDDVHAAGTAGGGTAVGGLAGTNIGGGSPRGAKLEDTMGREDADDTDSNEEQPEAFSGRAGGAVGGTPANKAPRGGKAEARPGGAKKPKPRKTRRGDSAA